MEFPVNGRGCHEVICHGDLHPFNLLLDETGTLAVLDWSAGLLAQRAYDAAFTSLVLAEPPLAVPRVARPLARAAAVCCHVDSCASTGTVAA